jgi:hypothetical protein
VSNRQAGFGGRIEDIGRPEPHKRGGHGPCPWRIRTSPGAPTPGERPLATHPRSRCGCSHARGRLTTRLMTT